MKALTVYYYAKGDDNKEQLMSGSWLDTYSAFNVPSIIIGEHETDKLISKQLHQIYLTKEQAENARQS